MSEIIIVVVIAFLLNIAIYAYAYLSWRKDCREIGKDCLAVSLGERMRAVFLTVTLPCILGALTRK